MAENRPPSQEPIAQLAYAPRNSLPTVRVQRFGLIGPGVGVGAGCGAGIGAGLVGGLGIGPGIPGLHVGFGAGIVCGVGIGFGYGAGVGKAWTHRQILQRRRSRWRAGDARGLSIDDVRYELDDLLESAKHYLRRLLEPSNRPTNSRKR
eukprot:jgi/Chlat1/6548/Chrsp45S06020